MRAADGGEGGAGSGPASGLPRLPHAPPFLLLDRVLELRERGGVFLKLVTAGDPCVGSDGVLPATLVLEALAQGGGALLSALEGTVPGPGFLAGVDGFRALEPVRVGDALRIEVEIIRHFRGATLLQGRALAGGRLRAEGRFTLARPR
jgi:3-hydroxymyristoyl/3-hydroxydecanoyl-(acyl carrier protein) dehydratase